MKDRKVYLGDSVYLAYDDYNLILTTENGYGASNTIVLEPQVYQALIQYSERLKEKDGVKSEE